ncbi:uncharacterized protein CC84DRAFT_557512 [Paraphaeosphaeria sporulosa]|uniref:Uncharacterized protein n=1 Tax=Paraphaeosphaeria sporulosa TaxID=1460663 RepID=A0A177CLH6_9PLEO|nr:uncharacterized protein CC84DRAFT_557512 [Paraphaeosphaeria sporulosa]OAG08156.1 hypothetical protein CC84DRAFT_557512 [Paraphaeosphaeria sporulosa]
MTTTARNDSRVASMSALNPPRPANHTVGDENRPLLRAIDKRQTVATAISPSALRSSRRAVAVAHHLASVVQSLVIPDSTCGEAVASQHPIRLVHSPKHGP